MTTVIDKLNWRYATKKFDASKTVPADKLERILEAVRLAPTSSGLQPFELIVVTNPAVRAQIRAIGYNQSQITDCSHLVVFAAWDDITADRINMMFDLTNAERGPNPDWENYRTMLLGMMAASSTEVRFQSATKQAYIGLGAALIAAAFEAVDTTPMEGFDAAALDQILGLPERHLRSVVILAVGYREAAGDWLVNLKKVRRARADFVTEVA
ncbi:nitroreductase/dihydropteridine reductase [Actimicrobium sp. GrIS 1.19]|uniref:NAD(P)H-dependent oxidoreductase n=1 Tax=Actimicrobium sp. GrIS 1.19 TaxID=3071708 RepID=UPI002E058219|nr:nitroreductase/dihydropteridine reductase [Actimicrobium sp. GrIS 1.19]